MVSVALGTLISAVAVFVAITVIHIALCGSALGLGLLIYGSIKTHKALNENDTQGKTNINSEELSHTSDDTTKPSILPDKSTLYSNSTKDLKITPESSQQI